MARTSRAERNRRRESALALVSQGMGFSDVVTPQMSQWGAPVYVPNGPFAGRMISPTFLLQEKLSLAWIEVIGKSN